MGFFETLGTSVGGIMSAKKNEKAAEKSRKRGLNYVEGLDWTPAYAQDQMSNGGAYQKTQSPLARSYLESVLTGNNPDTTFSGSPNAAYKKEQQAYSKDQMYGTPQQLQQQSAQNAATNPYQTWTPSNPQPGSPASAPGTEPGRAPGAIDYGKEFKVLADMGIGEDDHKKLMDAGMEQDKWRNAPELTQKSGKRGTSTEEIKGQVQQAYQAVLAKMNAGDVEGAKKLYGQLKPYIGLAAGDGGMGF
jgi:hypothetical protein